MCIFVTHCTTEKKLRKKVHKEKKCAKRAKEHTRANANGERPKVSRDQ